MFIPSSVFAVQENVNIVYRTDSPQLDFSVDQLELILQKQGYVPEQVDFASLDEQVNILILSDPSEAIYLQEFNGSTSIDSSIQKEGFKILQFSQNDRSVIVVMARDESGAMYGTLDLAEQIQIGGNLDAVEDKSVNPHSEFRAIKFNLPWSPYRDKDISGNVESMTLHVDTVRDLDFWESYLNMMAKNRFNVLTLWNRHPFTYMIRAKNFPEASPFSNVELAKWKRFWQQLFKMAKERGIDTYLVNWNIVVSPEMAKAYGVRQRSDTSELVQKYTRESVTQVINEYENLTGLGVTLADWMGNFGDQEMTPKEREDWIENTFVKGIQEANREARFIHRSVLAGSPTEMRRVINDANFQNLVWVPMKFNWSHGHSTPRLSINHAYHSGEIDERLWKPAPKNYNILWTVRNEDFFILRWGQPEFIRAHIERNNKEYAKGYIIGSEDYIPAEDYSHKIPSDHKTWQYAFEKQWLFYETWGRLLYNPDTSNEIFESSFSNRYGSHVGQKLLQASTLASNMPLELASFYRATWDFTLYSEGFLAPAKSGGLFDGVSPFISVDELIYHKTLDTTYYSIPDYVDAQIESKSDINPSMRTPLELANSLNMDGTKVVELVENLPNEAERNIDTLKCEIADMKTWAYLSQYFAEKLKGGVALERFRRTGEDDQKKEAISYLKKAAEYWDNVITITNSHYHSTPTVELEDQEFLWENYRNQVKRDIQIAQEAKPKNPDTLGEDN